MIFADSAPANHANWLENLQFFATLTTGLMVLWSMVSNRPQRREISFEEELVNQEEFERHTRDDAAALAKIDSALESIRAERRDDVNDLHHRITEVSQDVSALQTAADFTNQRLVQIDAKLDRAIERRAA